MIDEVADLLRKQIDMSLRGTFDRFNKHIYTYSLSVTGATLARYLETDWKKFTDGHRQMDMASGQTAGELMTDNVISITAAKDLKAAMRIAADEGCKVALNPDAMYKSWTGIFSAQGSSIALHRTDFTGSGGTACTIDLAVGTVMEAGTEASGGGKKLKSGEVVPLNLVNLCTKDFYKRAKREAWHWLRMKGASGAALFKKNADSETLRNIGTESSAKFKAVKAHGKAQAWAGGAEIKSKGGYQTTVAVMSLAKMLDKAEAVSVKGTYNTDIYNSVSKVEEEFRDYLEKTFDIDQYRNADTDKFEEHISVNLHATDAQGNSEFTKGKYDMPGIRRALESQAVAIANNLGKTLGYKKTSQEWKDMKASTPRSVIMERLVKAKLIEELLKIQGSRPDFRLKVNKKLLQQAKKDLKVKKTKKGYVLTRKTKKSKKVVKGKAGGKGQAAYRSRKKSVSKAKTAQSPIAIRNLLNEALPQMIASKMTLPALQFRTGRFANSARVEMVHMGTRGGTGIDYTYMKYPYQTFEPGFAQGSTMRDPRKIIGESIRELATAILGRQPHTIRRT